MNIREELKWIVPIAVVCVLVYANTIGGDFVYDDLRQILRNSLIQDNSMIWKALTSDVWAFKGDGSVVASNYWRPTFTAWHIINFRLFGTNPAGWHITNILLHTGICLLIFALLRKWAYAAATAFVITLIFAVHPIHVESVAWISGSPDLLFALSFLGSLWFASKYRDTASPIHLALVLVLYALALGAKEVAILCIPIYYLLPKPEGEANKKSISVRAQLLLLAAIAAAYFLLRWQVLGAVSRPPEDAIGMGSAILSVPSMFAFYVRQIVFPLWIGANYPLLPVEQPGLKNFLLPLLIGAAFIAAIWFLAKRSRTGWLAAAIFFLPLIPAMNATAFISEQIVHDRYLYLPLLGFLMLVVPFAAEYLSARNLVIAGSMVSFVLAGQTVRYNAAWTSATALWSWTANVDDSAFTSTQYGATLDEAGKKNEAIREFSKAVEKRPSARAYLLRARSYLALKRYAEAEADLSRALQFPRDRVEAYALYQIYEALGISYSEQGRFDEAINLFEKARSELPIYSASLAEKLAVVLYQSGRKDDALRVLEAAREQARRELLPESKNVFFRLGMLYAERGQREQARAAVNEYLKLTAEMKDEATTKQRAQAAQVLQQIK